MERPPRVLYSSLSNRLTLYLKNSCKACKKKLKKSLSKRDAEHSIACPPVLLSVTVCAFFKHCIASANVNKFLSASSRKSTMGKAKRKCHCGLKEEKQAKMDRVYQLTNEKCLPCISSALELNS